MPTPDEIRDAIAQDALEGIARVQVGSEEVEMMSIADRQKALDLAAGQEAASQPHFGIRMSRIRPPGTG